MAKKCDCGHSGSFPLFGEGFSRRRFLQVAGTGLVASYFADVVSPSLLQAAVGVKPALHNTAKNCILIFLSGAPSHVDTWDLKEGAWTPKDFAPTSYGEVRWPQGLMPKTAEHVAELGIIRSGLSWAAVHNLAQAWAQIARNPGGATGRIAPHIGAVVALEAQTARKEGDILPGFVSINQLMAGAGYLPAQYAPFGVQATTSGLPALTHPDGAARLQERWQLLRAIDPERSADAALGKNAADMSGFYDAAKTLIDSPDVNKLFGFSGDEHQRYGASNFGNSLVVARNLVAARRGTRFVQVTMGNWDHHSNIYGPTNSLYTQMKIFDPAFGALLNDLASMPGSESGRTQLDETLVVVLGEFGRTVGALNAQKGRDHFLRMSIVMAGGGVRGRVIGKTDERGAGAAEYGWSANRDIRPEDVTSTIYSALGIDYTAVRHDDPLGRGFEYVPLAREGTYGAVNELFT
ncbi:MAG TPA: DUF1501 domain-containing protein [Thermoanaerobaculia bacterium]|jgi:hypothetical protein|nr:DUF1501 domain-containing protein [Thermoanaerobaculia bacterium]